MVININRINYRIIGLITVEVLTFQNALEYTKTHANFIKPIEYEYTPKRFHTHKHHGSK